MVSSSQILERLAGRPEIPISGPTSVVSSSQIPEWLVGRPEWRDRPCGALVIGGDYKGLGAVRSLGRHNIPVWVLTDDHLLAGISRYAIRRLKWPDAGEVQQLKYLTKLCAESSLHGWTLYPVGDVSAAFVSRHHSQLREQFRLTVPPWDVLKWAYDKRLTYQLAADLGVDCPWTRIPANRAEVAQSECRFPVILKPAIKETFNKFTIAKAWRIDNQQQLLDRYDLACTMVDPDAVMIQELIPGGGQEQFSYAALALEGRPLAWLVARRTRQYPIDFGRASSFVESVHMPEVEDPARRLIQSMGFTGLIEIEFKRDPFTGVCKLLDINPRIWGWHTLGQRAGTDFTYLLWCLSQGESLQETSGRVGIRWVRMTTDLPAAAMEIKSGRLSARAYIRSLRGAVETAIFATDDPLPALLEIPLSGYMVLKRGWI